jgi:uncharacterized protein YodC (DUF2158 family)
MKRDAFTISRLEHNGLLKDRSDALLEVKRLKKELAKAKSSSKKNERGNVSLWIGSIVRLRSGGPSMTIEEIIEETAGRKTNKGKTEKRILVRVVWFDDKSEMPQTLTVGAETLQAAH